MAWDRDFWQTCTAIQTAPLNSIFTSKGSTSQCTAPPSGHISCKDKGSEIALLLRGPSRSHWLSQNTLITECTGGLEQVFPSPSASGVSIYNICLENMYHFVISLGSRGILFTLTRRIYDSVLLEKPFFLGSRSFLYPQSSGEKKINPTIPAQQEINYYATILFRLVQARQICLNSRAWTSNFELSFIESKTTKWLEPDPVRRIMFNMFVALMAY